MCLEATNHIYFVMSWPQIVKPSVCPWFLTGDSNICIKQCALMYCILQNICWRSISCVFYIYPEYDCPCQTNEVQMGFRISQEKVTSLTPHCSTKLRNSLQLNFHMLEHPLLLYIDMACGADLASMAPNNAMSLSGDQMRLSTSSLDDTNKTRWGIFVISLSQAGGWIPSYLIILKKLVVGSHHISSFSIDHFSSIWMPRPPHFTLRLSKLWFQKFLKAKL